MPTLRGVLLQQTDFPRNLEMALPAGLPSVSQLMTSLAAGVPDATIPDVPGVQALADLPGQIQIPQIAPGATLPAPGQGSTLFQGPSGLPFPAAVPDIIRGVESALPAGVPTLGSLFGQPAGGSENSKASTKAAPGTRGGGYRPIGGSARGPKIQGSGYRSV